MATERQEKKHLLKPVRFRTIAIVLGIVIFAASTYVSAQGDLDNAARRLATVVEYVGNQCAIYSKINQASETKSLLRVEESAEVLAKTIADEKQGNPFLVLTDAQFGEYAQELYLTGAVLLDENGNVQNMYPRDETGETVLAACLARSTVMEVAAYPEKSYLERLTLDDGSHVDMAAFGRRDKKGVLIAFFHTPLEYVQTYNLAFQNLLQGYRTERDGTIAVAGGNKIVASNDETLLGRRVEEVPVLSSILQNKGDGAMHYVPTHDVQTGGCYGMLDRGHDYYVYVYIPEKAVYETTPRNMLLALFIYVVALAIIQLLRRRTERRYHQKQLEQERSYQDTLREAAHRAESANVAKTEFLQRMSPDIRTPINGIRGMVEIAEQCPNDMERQAECRKKIYEASGLLLELVNEVLDMGKLESGEVVLEHRPFNLQELMDEIQDTVAANAAERGITIDPGTVNLPHPNLVGSPLHVKRMLMNIISNAVKYNKENGTITLGCEETAFDGQTAMIRFHCKDTGIGMSKEFQQHIFEPFVQENNSARSSYTGTGLGMAITKSLVDRMGGTITFESKLGEGSEFYVVLPFEVSHEPAAAEKKETNEQELSLAGMRILVAEDNALNMEIAQFLLKNAGAAVQTASNGRQAVDAFKASEPGSIDVILMDIMMPEMDGYTATRTIRGLKRSDAKTVPIIAMTANAFPEDRQKAYEAGMTEHLAKPLETKLLLQALAKIKRNKT